MKCEKNEKLFWPAKKSVASVLIEKTNVEISSAELYNESVEFNGSREGNVF